MIGRYAVFVIFNRPIANGATLATYSDIVAMTQNEITEKVEKTVLEEAAEKNPEIAPDNGWELFSIQFLPIPDLL